MTRLLVLDHPSRDGLWWSFLVRDAADRPLYAPLDFTPNPQLALERAVRSLRVR